MSSRRLLVSAFGINSGGGLVLLTALAPGLRGWLRGILLDSRLKERRIDFEWDVAAVYVPRSFRARLLSLDKMAAAGKAGDVLLCFNSLPPPRKSRARVVVYVQAPHFVDAHRGIRYSPLTSLRLFLERMWFRWGIGNCDEIWVQTRTMADTVRAQYPAAAISVVPLVDEELSHALPALSAAEIAARGDYSDFSFFYPADIVGHKNHANLLKAWELLAREGEAPKLYLTIDPQELCVMVDRNFLDRSKLSDVVSLGRIPRAEVLNRLKACSALIFPSMAETFGLPLLEAAALKVPVIAGERDFVRDVCVPDETFDPSSPRSIAMAVRRFMNGAETPAKYFSAEEFVRRLLA